MSFKSLKILNIRWKNKMPNIYILSVMYLSDLSIFDHWLIYL